VLQCQPPGGPFLLGKEVSLEDGSRYYLKVVRMQGKAQIVSTAKRSPAMVKVKSRRPLGKEQPVAAVTLGLKVGARGSANFPFLALDDNKGLQDGKRKVVKANCGLLWEWRSQLEKIKWEVDRALLRVIEEYEMKWRGTG
jgi:hypothetical protein